MGGPARAPSDFAIAVHLLVKSELGINSAVFVGSFLLLCCCFCLLLVRSFIPSFSLSGLLGMAATVCTEIYGAGKIFRKWEKNKVIWDSPFLARTKNPLQKISKKR
jgi:hypothetical protein